MNSPLESLNVASPCREDWAKMTGDERVRACAKCRLNVYNLSEMSKTDAERLLLEKEGRLCVRFFRRADGTVLTKDCPVGLRAARLKIAKMAAGVVALAAAIFAGVGLRRAYQRTFAPTMGEIMGDVAPRPLMGSPAPSGQ